MTDWRQIQARIRKAKNSPDALTKLLELFQRTRDAMVAWELGTIEEKAERNSEAAKWYTIAAQRFRRSEWKTKAEEALTRLGVALPVANESEAAAEGNHSQTEGSSQTALEPQVNAPGSRVSAAAADDSDASGDADSSESENHEAAALSADSSPEQNAPGNSVSPEKKKRRRGRRGGRGRRRKESSVAPSVSSGPVAQPVEPSSVPPPPLEPIHHREPHLPAAERRRFERIPAEVPPPPPAPARMEPPALQFPSERTAHGRSGDPALASRMAQLESMLRRLVASPLRRLDEADKAPAGPGVFLLSDSDQTSSYYIEACQTLRVGLANLTRGNRGGKNFHGRGSSDEGVKSKLAEHLGIHESKVSQYLKDHCVVRWLQLDDDAPYLAHFAIGILRTPLNLD